jgi:hypothetical protein
MGMWQLKIGKKWLRRSLLLMSLCSLVLLLGLLLLGLLGLGLVLLLELVLGLSRVLQ